MDSSSNEKRNRMAWDRKSICEQETGKTAGQLAREQQELRDQFYRRLMAEAAPDAREPAFA